MRIALRQIAQAIDIDLGDDAPSTTIAVALKTLESIVDGVAEGLEDDCQCSALGDVSNLLQLLREEMTR